MAETRDTVRVDVTNPLEGEPEEVQQALAGLAYIAGGLIAVGEIGIVSTETQALNSLFDRINSGIENPGVEGKLKRQHPAFEKLLEDTEQRTTDPRFASFLHRLGVFDTSYTLAPSAEDPKHFSLTILGYD